MQFKKYSASKPFQNLIAYFWTLESVEGIESNMAYRFVPDAYVDWVFHLGTPWSLKFADHQSPEATRKFHVFGQIERYLDLTLPKDKLKVFGVKFHPWAANKLWNVNMNYLTNSCMDLSDLDLPHITFLKEQICMATSISERIDRIEGYIRENLEYNERDTLKDYVNAMDVNTQTLSNHNISARRLQQRFKTEIGISSKLFMKTLRINDVIESIKANPEQLLTQVALEHNYFDQSHLIKDFKKFTGYSPSAFLKAINPDGDILNLRIH